MNEKKSHIIILFGILKRLGRYDMSSFKNRLTFQKTVYFLQIFGLSFGYNFNWYVYGPYSSILTKDGYEMEKVKNVPKIAFINPKYEESLAKLDKFLGKKRHDADWLELLASIHFLKSTKLATTKRDIIETITHKQTHFDEQDCEKALEYLEGYGL